MVFLGDDNWNLVLNMMIGIQMAVRSVKGFQEMIYEEPKDFGLKYYFELVPRRFGNEEYKSTIYSFTDYAPNTFNHIRKLFKIDNEDYIGSIGPNRLMASLMMGEVSSMTSLTSQGKSGSFFYYTADSKYMLKTMSYREYKFLRSILEDYYYYLKQNPDTMITRFYGLHKLIEKNEKGDEICRSYFVIMANVFNTK
jgi:1-phosphatidylinositol-4-phosphate 5-kinase